VVDDLMRDPYYHAPPPKSTGRELYSARYITDFIARCRTAQASASHADIIATAFHDRP